MQPPKPEKTRVPVAMLKRKSPAEVATVGDYIELCSTVFKVRKVTAKDLVLRSVPVPAEMQAAIDERNSQPVTNNEAEPQQLATDGE